MSQSLEQLFTERIVVLDGAMGTVIQGYGLAEKDFRGDRFTTHHRELKGNNELLSITRPDVIEEIHRRYLEAGADLIETNTFSATSIAQGDYELPGLVHELNVSSARCARRAVEAHFAKTGQRGYVAGAIGPLNRTLSLSPDVTRPEYRAVTWNQVVEAYEEQIRALLEGGVDTLLVETIFDTLNCKAALFAIESVFDDLGRRVPVMISVTITDASGRTLSGQTLGAFYESVRHSKPLSVGINCALGGKEMRPYIEELSRLAECHVSCYPNAGLPNAFGGYDETPDEMAATLSDFARQGWINAVGGCCGSTPEHIAAIAKAARKIAPRQRAADSHALRLSGLEALVVAP